MKVAVPLRLEKWSKIDQITAAGDLFLRERDWVGGKLLNETRRVAFHFGLEGCSR
jgi:hypothetical protein